MHKSYVNKEKWILTAEELFCWMLFAAIIAFIFGVLISRDDVNSRLPNCQEDEYLYPVDYSGPGNNITSDYECVHIDFRPSGDKVVITNG